MTKMERRWLQGIGLGLAVIIILLLLIKRGGGITQLLGFPQTAPRTFDFQPGQPANFVPDVFTFNPDDFSFPPWNYNPDNISLNLNPPAAPGACGCGCQAPTWGKDYQDIANAYGQHMQQLADAFAGALFGAIPPYVTQYFNDDALYNLATSDRQLFDVGPPPDDSNFATQPIGGPVYRQPPSLGSTSSISFGGV